MQASAFERYGTTDPREVAVSFSRLKKIARSPAHYLADLRATPADNASKRFGRLVHKVTLGGDYAVWEGERRGNAWKDFAKLNDGTEICTASELVEAKRIATALDRHPLAAPLLIGAKEQLIEWELRGRKCKSVLDVIGNGFIADLKTTTDARPDWMIRQAFRMGYHAQMAWYQRAAASFGGEVYLIAVETTDPYPVTVLRVTPRSLAEGDKMCRLWFEQLMNCEESNQWPEYSQSIVDMDPPGDFSLLVDGEEIET